MSRMFIDASKRVPITEFERGTVLDDDGNPLEPNVVYIRPRMDVGTKNKVTGAMLKMGGGEVEIDLGANLTALLVHNILGWDGPDFRDEHGRPLPVTEERIRQLDPSEPLVERVINEISERNKPKASPNPKSAAPNGSTSDGVPSSLAVSLASQ